MKKFIIFIMMLSCVFALSACSNSKQEQFSVYSFCGENEQFEITNGVIVLTDTKDVFDGGDLRVVQDDVAENISSYRATFYTIVDGEKTDILIDEVVDESNNIDIEGDLGRTSGGGNSIYGKYDSVDELTNNLWCELKTTDINGRVNTYIIKLNSTEITN